MPRPTKSSLRVMEASKLTEISEPTMTAGRLSLARVLSNSWPYSNASPFEVNVDRSFIDLSFMLNKLDSLQVILYLLDLYPGLRKYTIFKLYLGEE